MSATKDRLAEIRDSTYVQGIEYAATVLIDYVHDRDDQFWHAWNMLASTRDKLRCPECTTSGQTGALDHKDRPVMCTHPNIKVWASPLGPRNADPEGQSK